MRRLLPWIFCVSVVAGCHPGGDGGSTVVTAPPSKAPPATQTEPPPANSTLPPATPKPVPPAADQPPAAPASTAAIPDNLKSPAYEYYGLSNTKPVDYEVLGDVTAGIRTGAQTSTLKEVKDGKAYFDQVRSGGLYIQGNDEVVLDTDGVHVVSSTAEQTNPNELEFPSDITKGKSWTSHDKISQTGLSFDVTSVSTIAGPTTLKTKRGTLDVLRVTSKSEGTENGQKLRMDTEAYYAKGIGLVKATIVTAMANGQKSTLVQQIAD